MTEVGWAQDWRVPATNAGCKGQSSRGEDSMVRLGVRPVGSEIPAQLIAKLFAEWGGRGRDEGMSSIQLFLVIFQGRVLHSKVNDVFTLVPSLFSKKGVLLPLIMCLETLRHLEIHLKCQMFLFVLFFSETFLICISFKCMILIHLCYHRSILTLGFSILVKEMGLKFFTCIMGVFGIIHAIYILGDELE